ncbi:peptidoglycan-binding protein [Roseibium sp. MMSF_3412]|uniref:peptidoglycan-binding domain-containing protein n=1 Tax=Roseibium sp. MMSF_3412 TaxID=3046712 RepID=UPI00273EBB71|nr:peptidoglycan-binding domain-containing protein [Roseibium sp. MMSF_3412]
MARAKKQKNTPKPQETLMARAGHIALDNPVAAGGAVVMGLTSCLIIANAIGLQPGRHPAPLFSTRERAAEPVLPEPSGRSNDLQVQEISTLVLDLQISLRRIGLYEGPLDGLSGPATERAIRAFERKAGQAETGRANEALLALILLHGDAPQTSFVPIPRAKPGAGSSPSPSTSPRPGISTSDVAETETDPHLQKIQKALSDLGYGPLKADGVMGANTTAAIKRFELDRGLPLTGEPGSETIERLEMVSGLSLSG